MPVEVDRFARECAALEHAGAEKQPYFIFAGMFVELAH